MCPQRGVRASSVSPLGVGVCVAFLGCRDPPPPEAPDTPLPPSAEPGRMRWPGVSLWGLLWLWVPLAGGRPVRLEKVRADTRNLTRTLSTRIQQLQVRPGGGREGQGGLGGCPPPSQGHPIGFTACPMSPKGGGWAVRWGALRPRVVAAGAGGGHDTMTPSTGWGALCSRLGGESPERDTHGWGGGPCAPRDARG